MLSLYFGLASSTICYTIYEGSLSYIIEIWYIIVELKLEAY